VIAKVTRDRIMCELHEQYPEYDFNIHKGYCTTEHQEALERYGPCPEHRRRWVNVMKAMGNNGAVASLEEAEDLDGSLVSEQ
jgi:ribonuclease HII